MQSFNKIWKKLPKSTYTNKFKANYIGTYKTIIYALTTINTIKKREYKWRTAIWVVIFKSQSYQKMEHDAFSLNGFSCCAVNPTTKISLD